MSRHGNILICVFAAAVMAGAAFHARASEVAGYRNNVREAREIVLALLRETVNPKAGSPAAGYDSAKVKRVRELLPASQRLETAYGTQQISNTWLHDRLDDLAASNDLASRSVILSDIDERLSAIMWKLDESERAQRSGPAKDEEKQKLREILSREEFQKPTDQQESLFQRWLREFLEWLQSLFPEPAGVSRPSVTGMPNAAWWLQFVIIGIVAALIGYGLYRFGPQFIPRLRRRRADRREERVILGERISDDTHPADIFDEAERLARAGDVRGAIRKGYIALLCELSDRKLIGLVRHKTNRDYLRDMRRHREFEMMRELTGSFEQHWYGRKMPDDTAWDRFSSGYKETIARL